MDEMTIPKYKKVYQKRNWQRKTMLTVRLDAALIALLKARAMERRVSVAAILAAGARTECNRVQA